jgi:hypothetical protein
LAISARDGRTWLARRRLWPAFKVSPGSSPRPRRSLREIGFVGVRCENAVQSSREAISASACVIYVGYLFELAQVRLSIFSDERLSFALAWLPNLLMTLTGVGFLSVRDDRQFRSDT